MADESNRDRRITDDVGTVREWADEAGVVPVRTARAKGTSEEVALVPRDETGDHERLDWAAFGRVLHESDKLVRSDDSGDAGGLSVVDADAVDVSEADYEASRRTGTHRERDEYGEREMRGVGAPAAEAGEDREGVDAGGERVDRGTARTAPRAEDEGKPVVDAAGRELGTVTAVDKAESVVHVDVDRTVVDRVASRLGWDDVEETEYALPGENVHIVTDEAVEIEGEVEPAEDR